MGEGWCHSKHQSSYPTVVDVYGWLDGTLNPTISVIPHSLSPFLSFYLHPRDKCVLSDFLILSNWSLAVALGGCEYLLVISSMRMSLTSQSLPNGMKYLGWATEWSSSRVFIVHKIHWMYASWTLLKVIVEFGVPLCAHRGVLLGKDYWGESGLECNIHIKKKIIYFFVFFSPTIFNTVWKKIKCLLFNIPRNWNLFIVYTQYPWKIKHTSSVSSRFVCLFVFFVLSLMYSKLPPQGHMNVIFFSFFFLSLFSFK